MDTESAVAIICIVIALVILISLTVFTMVKAWRQISRELAEREHCQRTAPVAYENMGCIATGNAVSDNDGTSNGGHALTTTDRGHSADTHANREVSCAHNDQAVNKRILVQVESNDTSF